MLKNINKLIDLLFPWRCILCGNACEQSWALCEACEVDLPWNTHSCRQCALPINTTNTGELLCPQCQSTPPPFERCYALFHYQDPINHLITQLKFHQKLIYANLFGSLMANYLLHHYQNDPSYPSVLIPMPLHKKRLRERGFNQALEIARPIAKKMQLSLDIKSCQRIKVTATQSSQHTIKQRENNVNNAFTSNKLHARHVLIIDDVMTTGFTVREMSKVLFDHGASRIDVACCARTDLKN